ncbi:hypothetical protein [Streptomyces sp. NPDC000133]
MENKPAGKGDGSGTEFVRALPVLVLTSDRDDWSKLCGDRMQIKDV